MPALPALEVQDVLKVQALFVVPSSGSSSRAPAPSHAKPAAASSGLQRLAPIEMAAQSIHLAPASQTPSSFVLGGKKEQALPPAPHQGRVLKDPEAGLGYPLHAKPWVVGTGVVVPLAYTCCGLTLCLCHLLAPGYMHACALLLSPVWTLTLALHAAGMMGDFVWFWLGVLTILLLPFVILNSHLLFVAFYLAVFAAFGSGRFWMNLKGLPFLAVGLCWFGLASSLVLSVVLQDQPAVQLGVACFFALAAASISSSSLPKLSCTLLVS
jgi:hypothetical protein